MNKFRKLGFIDYRGGSKRHLEAHSSLFNIILHDALGITKGDGKLIGGWPGSCGQT